MRWDNLRIEERQGDSAHLPGFRDPATVRRFDAPEAMGIRFYEVEARSAINKVPEKSRMPFRFTVNPYRGCTHACTYCLSGETPILLADGRTKRLAEIQPGERIYGTVREGRYRRYVMTEVLDHWATVKPAYRIVLEDGSQLIASGDHRFLTRRGWKHVIGAEQGALRRPHLTIGSKLIGTGGFAEAPSEISPEYRRGYLCGVIRGDGHIGSYSYERPGRNVDDVHRFRLALVDLEALRRAKRYLLDVDVATDEFEFRTAYAGAQPARAIRTQSREKVARIADVIRWPGRPSDEWRKGFLAGIFDAEGGCGGKSRSNALRIANCDMEIIDWTTWCMRGLGFQVVVERTRQSNGLSYVRLRGGLKEKLRFFHMTDPVITRKRSFVGTALKSDAPLKVASIEPLKGKWRLFDITTGTGDFIANGVVSHNCFARPTHTYLDMNAREDFEREIVVKVNAPELVRKELAKPSWKGDHVALGTNTDPYQWVEGRYELMRGIWEAMRDYSNPCSVLTKSPLLLRDLDLMKEIRAHTDFNASLSIPTLEEKAWRATEPHTPHPAKRIEAVAKLNEAGIPTGVLIAPLIPGVNDDPEQVKELVDRCAEAGATHISGIGLHLRADVKDIWFDWLHEHRPDLVPRYEELYRRGAYLPSEEKKRLSALVRPAGSKKPSPPRRWRGRRDATLRGAMSTGHATASPGENEEVAPDQPGDGAQASLF